MIHDHYTNGYYDGFRQRPNNLFYGNNCKEFTEYQNGYDKGFADKEFCEVYSDEALSVEGYGT